MYADCRAFRKHHYACQQRYQPQMSPEEIRLGGLPAVINASARVLILGTFPSRQSLQKQQYYANPQNQFWPIMEALFGIAATAPYGERIRHLQERGISLWDVIGSCRRVGSSDSTIRDAVPNDIHGLLAQNPAIRFVGLNGRTGERMMHKMQKSHGELPGIMFAYLPSTSPAHAKTSIAEKISLWSRIREFL
jgi:TDG/mug DNA glycosylase family protein